MSLRKKIVIVMIVIVLCVSLVSCLATYKLTNQVVSEFESEIATMTAAHTAQMLQTYLANVRTTLVRMVENADVQQMADYQNLSAPQIQGHSEVLQNRVADFVALSKFVGSNPLEFINIYLKNGITATTANADIFPYSDFEGICAYLAENEILSRDDYKSIVWYDVETVNTVASRQVRCVLGVRFLYDRVSMERIGSIVVGVQTDKLLEVYRPIFPAAMMVTKFGDVITGGTSMDAMQPVPELLMQRLVSARYNHETVSYELNEQVNELLLWRMGNSSVYFVVPVEEKELLRSGQIMDIFFKVTIIMILTASIAAVLFSKTLTNGLFKLKRVAQRVAGGQWDARFTPKLHDEVAYVGIQFNEMLDQLQQYYDDVQRYEQEKQDLQLSLLNAKLNPHLLYNTLNLVVWAIKRGDSERAESLIYGMSDYFKRALAKGREYTSLEEEVALIRSYLDLQRLAGDKDYRLETHIEPELTSYEILHLLFQPIVENSVGHGFRDFRDDGTICITAKKSEDGRNILVTIHDDGIGMTDEQLEKLNYSLNEGLYTDNAGHYGLRNTARRIKTYYGADYGIKVSGEAGVFTKVTMRLPYERQRDEELSCSS